MATILEPKKRNKSARPGEPVWDIAKFYPLQGSWTEEDYFALERVNGNWMIELANGCLEVLPMPSLFHQRITKYMCRCVDDFLGPDSDGETAMAPLPVRLFEGQIREPDLVFFEKSHIRDIHKSLRGADLVMEVVSPGEEARERDLETKRREYAKAKIREYWIIDPELKTITVLTLSGKNYKVYGEYKLGEQAASKLLKGFTVDVAEVFAAGEGK
jgi:Uma2 family endonuclease